MSLRDLNQQVGCLNLILLLFRESPLSKREIVQKLGRSPQAAYGALRVLKELDLIVQVEAQSFPYRKDVSLTEKGRRVAEHLIEVERILAEEK